MRQQDRLLAALAHRDPLYRAYVARMAERLVVHYDSEDLVTSFRRMWLEARSPLGAHYFCAFNELLPWHLRARYDPSQVTLRSQFVGRRPALPRASQGTAEARQALVRSATHLLEPCILALRDHTRSSQGPHRLECLSALARFHHRAVESFLAERLADDAEGATAALLLTACFGPPEDDKLLARLDAVWPRDSLPEFVLSLRYLPTEGALSRLARAARHRSPGAQWLAAACLDHFGKLDCLPLLGELLGATGWSAVHALESLARLEPGKQSLALIEAALDRHPQPLIRMAALRALVNVGGSEAVELCLRELGSERSAFSAAQAARTLTQLEAPPETRARALLPLLKSPSLEVATQAVLGLIGADDRKAGLAIRDWLVDGGEEERVQAAYCLGYYPGQSSIGVLEHLLRTDPSPAVQLQALRALAYYERTDTVNGIVAACLGSPSERLALEAMQLLATPENFGNEALAARLAAVARGDASVAVRRSALETLGRFEVPAARGALDDVLRAHAPDQALLLGAIEGLGLAGPEKPSLDRLKPALTNRSPEVRAAASRVLFSWGDSDGVEVLARMLRGGLPEAAAAVRALEELAVVSDFLLLDPRFSTLADCLKGNLKSPAYLDFSRQELGLGQAPGPSRGAVDPDAIVLSRASWMGDSLGGQSTPQLLAEVEAGRQRPPRKPAPSRRTRETSVLENPPVAGLEGRFRSPGLRRWRLVAAGLGAGLLAFLLYVTLAGGRDEPPPETLPFTAESASAGSVVPRALAVLGVEGPVRVDGGTSAESLRAGTRLESGVTVQAEKGGAVQFGLEPEGNSVSLGGEGRFKLERLQGGASDPELVEVSIAELQGRLVFDLKWGRPRIEVVLGDRRVRGWRGRYAVESGPAGSAVLVALGRVEVTDAKGRFTLIADGQKLTFQPGAPEGSLGPFEPAREGLDGK